MGFANHLAPGTTDSTARVIANLYCCIMSFDDRTMAARADVLTRINRRADARVRGDEPFVALDREYYAKHVPVGAWGSACKECGPDVTWPCESFEKLQNPMHYMD